MTNFSIRLALFVLAAGILGPESRELQADPFQNTPAAKPELSVAITTDIAPYVVKNATGGLEIDLARRLLKGYSLRFVQMPYSELQTAVREKHVDVSFGVQAADDGVFYSDNFITFVNAAISKKTDTAQIGSIADLADRRVLAWQNAYLELGDEFKALFSPKSPHRRNYQEVANQKDQVEMFWKSKDAVIVIDRAVFAALSREQGHSMSDVTSHDIFPAETDFRAAFKDAAVRDKFNRGLTELCENGGYANIYRHYDVELPYSICDRRAVEAAAAKYTAALNAIFSGDAAPMMDVWSHAEDVVYMGPSGGYQVGWAQVRALWQEKAAQKLGGKVEPQKLEMTLGRELAVVYDMQVGDDISVHGKRAPVKVRATSVFRKESGTWKMISHHTDLFPILRK